jgi:probable F420-dependent oxidoreductase
MSVGTDRLDDFGALREAASALDEAGIDVMSYGGHVVTSREGRFQRPIATYAATFRDFFVVFADLAAITNRLRFRSSILILPLFSTVHVAKQSADLSLLSGGRFELGVGVSWNEAEYRAMGQDFSKRGARLEEQLVVLTRLWTEPFVSFHGEFHDIDELGLGQLPASPIPVWIGCGESARSLSRVARLADGWMPIGPPSSAHIEELRAAAAMAGRSPVGVTGRITWRPDDANTSIEEARTLQAAGVSEITITPPGGTDLAAQVDAVVAARAELVRALGE